MWRILLCSIQQCPQEGAKGLYNLEQVHVTTQLGIEGMKRSQI